LAPEAAAFGIAETVEETMAQAARIHAIESGATLPGRTLIAFGGAAPLHATRLAEKLDIERVLIPRAAGVGSAVGFLRAPASYEIVRTLYQKLGSFDAPRVNAELEAIGREALEFVRVAAGPAARITNRLVAFMRYAGQGHEIAVEVPLPPYRAEDAQLLKRLFESAYERLYGRTVGALADVEITAWAVRASAPPVDDLPADGATGSSQRAASERRRVFEPRAQAFVHVPVHPRAALAVGAAIAGPALIVEDETTTFVTAAFMARVTPHGDIELTRRSQP
ncbi:MAG: hydantoinase/oxoprolinase family protein, partial [Alphaproteobacteria bacterium]|nr:hydantoinase/oxoprolinase family protein [Alphaproteobacteria bacterium]